MGATEALEARPDRPQLLDDVAETTLGVGDHGTRGGETNLGRHHGVRLRVRRRGVHVTGEVVDHLARVVEAAGPAGGDHGVQVVEHVPRVAADSARPRVRERTEPISRVDPVEHEPPQQRAGVEHLERHAFGPVVVDLRVVDRQHLVVASCLEQVQREMPPVVHREQVARPPVGLPAAKEADAVVDLALHLEGVDDRVDTPHVVGVALDRGEADVLGPVVVAGLLGAEGVHALHEPGVRVLGIEARQRAADAVAQVLSVAHEEVEQVADQQCEHVGRPADEQVVERAGRVVPAPFDPRGDGGRVGLLPLVERQSGELGCRLPGPSHVGGVRRHEDEVGHEDLPHGQGRGIGGDLVGGGHKVGVVPQEAVERMVVAGHLLGCTGDLVAVGIARSGGQGRCHLGSF